MSDEAVERAARVIQQACDAGVVYDDAGEPLSAAETIARALAAEGLLAPAPLRQEWSTADEGIDAHTCCGYEDRAVIEAHAARCGYQIVHRWVTEWQPEAGQ